MCAINHSLEKRGRSCLLASKQTMKRSDGFHSADSEKSRRLAKRRLWIVWIAIIAQTMKSSDGKHSLDCSLPVDAEGSGEIDRDRLIILHDTPGGEPHLWLWRGRYCRYCTRDASLPRRITCMCVYVCVFCISSSWRYSEGHQHVWSWVADIRPLSRPWLTPASLGSNNRAIVHTKTNTHWVSTI